MLERDVERLLCEGVKALGGKAWKWVSPGSAGVPDRLVLLPNGEVWMIELKTEAGKLTALQKSCAEKIKALKGNYACLMGKTDVAQWLYDRTKALRSLGYTNTTPQSSSLGPEPARLPLPARPFKNS
jgi:anti-sigma factor ChrR (cupin superfamily)